MMNMIVLVMRTTVQDGVLVSPWQYTTSMKEADQRTKNEEQVWTFIKHLVMTFAFELLLVG
jgi:hypothetical protein